VFKILGLCVMVLIFCSKYSNIENVQQHLGDMFVVYLMTLFQSLRLCNIK
jgi:hypothetical protein